MRGRPARPGRAWRRKSRQCSPFQGWDAVCQVRGACRWVQEAMRTARTITRRSWGFSQVTTGRTSLGAPSVGGRQGERTEAGFVEKEEVQLGRPASTAPPRLPALDPAGGAPWCACIASGPPPAAGRAATGLGGGAGPAALDAGRE